MSGYVDGSKEEKKGWSGTTTIQVSRNLWRRLEMWRVLMSFDAKRKLTYNDVLEHFIPKEPPHQSW